MLDNQVLKFSISTIDYHMTTIHHGNKHKYLTNKDISPNSDVTLLHQNQANKLIEFIA